MLRPLFLLIASISFGMGITLPLVKLEKLYFFTEAPSLIDVVIGLWNEGSFTLSTIIVLFSIIFPVAKLYSTFRTMLSDEELPSWIAALGKWSLMDVLLVAILIFAAKTNGFASAYTQPGIWFYMASTIFSSLSVTKFARLK